MELKDVLYWLYESDVGRLIESVDPDANGGTGIYLNGNSGKTAWIALMDSGARTVVLSGGGNKARGYQLSLSTLELLKSYLLAV